MPALQLTLLGSFAAHWKGETITSFPTDKVRALLAYLALEGERPLRRETVATLLWPNYPDAIARRNLRQNLHRLTHLLDKLEPGLSQQLLTITRQTVQLNRAHLWLDVAELEARLTAVAHHPHRHLHTCPPCLDALTQAAQLARGDLLAGFTLPDAPLFEEWLTIQRERLHYQSLQLLHTLAEAQLQRGEYEAAHAHAAHQIALEPWREEAHRQMILALARQGRRSEALAQYAECARLLEKEMGLLPAPETETLYNEIVSDSLPPAATAAAGGLHYFPAGFTPFIGREQECAQIAAYLAAPDCRLLTVVAPGGMGKTRLIAHAVQTTLGQKQGALDNLFPNGCYFVPLAEATSEEQLLNRLSQALALPPAPAGQMARQIAGYLQEKRLLLLLDNFEQLRPTAVTLQHLLENAPGLSLLVSSREPLALPGEWLLWLEGLPYPAAADPETADYAAVQLFAQAARRAQADFALDEINRTAVVRICQLTAGMPLALELAAAWIPQFDCAQIAAQISRNLDFLQAERPDLPPRHRNMQAMFQQAWDFLDEPAQRVLAQLAVFSGSFDLEAAQTVTEATLPTLLLLLDKSLLQRQADGRYILHKLIQQFAAAQLAAHPARQTEMYAAHSHHYLKLAQGYGAALYGPQAQAVMQALGLSQANLAQAWQTAVTQANWPLLQDGLEGFAAYYRLSGQLREAGDFLAAALQKLAGDDDLPALLAQLQLENGRLQQLQGNYAAALAHLQSANQYYQQSDQLTRRAQTSLETGMVMLRQGEHDQARTLFNEGLTLARETEDKAIIGRALNHLGSVALLQGNYPDANALFAESLALRRQQGAKLEIAASLQSMGNVAMALGDYQTAITMYAESLQIKRAIGDKLGMATTLNNMAGIAYNQGDYAIARERYSASLTLRREMGDKLGVSRSSYNLGVALMAQGDYAAAQTQFTTSLEMARALGDKWGVASSLSNLGSVALAQGDYATAEAMNKEGLTIYRDMGDKRSFAAALTNQGSVALVQGAYTAARALFAESFSLCQEIAHKSTTAFAQLGLGLAELRLGMPTADDHIRQSLRLRQELGEKAHQISSLIGVAGAALAQNDALRAAQMLGAVAAATAEMKTMIEPAMRQFHDETVTAVRDILGEAAFQAAWAEGEHMTLDEAVASCLPADVAD